MGRGLWIGILGPVTVVRDGTELRPLPPAQRALLGLLALAPGSPVQLDSIVDVLWDERVPASAVSIVQTYVSRLRSALDADLPPHDGVGYRLRVSERELDLLAFRQLTGLARDTQAAGALDEACGAYERALGLWRGEPLADVEVLRGHQAVAALVAERTAAVLDYADAALSAGNDQVIPHLLALTARDPLNEAAHARLMIALAASGRQADALRAYGEIRRRLDEELGVLPGPALCAAHAKVLHQDIPSAHPVAAWHPVFQLPAAPADFTGRLAECDEVIGLISPRSDHPGVPVMAISGPPGVGKTSLALYVAHSIRARFPDGQLWVQLSGASARPRDPGDVLGELLRALGLPGAAIPDDFAERAVCYRSRLAGRKILVVADDAATAAQIRPLIPGTAGCALVVTSRMRLEGLDGARLIPLDVLPADDAVGLLAHIVGAGRVVAERVAAEELVQACGALPLALRIAGAKLAARPLWPVSVMVRKLTGEHDRLRELEAGDLSVRASIASSYESLPERPRRAFGLLALLGPADFAEWVIGALLGEPDVADVTSDLVGRSLLTPLSADATGEPRYRLHDLLRDFAVELLANGPTSCTDQARERLLEGWLQLAHLADAGLPREPYFPPVGAMPVPAVVPERAAGQLTAEPIAWFTTERINLLNAVEQACAGGRLDLARQLASSQCAFQHIQDRHDEAEQIWRILAAQAEQAGDLDLEVHARLRIGALMVRRGDAPHALHVFDQCIQAAEAIGDLESMALGLYWRGASACDVGDSEQARSDCLRGARVAHRTGSHLAESLNLGLLGIALALCGDRERAVEACEKAVAVAAGLGGSYELAALHDLAFTCTLTGHYRRAVSVCLRQIELSRQLGDVRREALSNGVLGDAYSGLGDYQLAAETLLEALPVFRDHQARRHHALCLAKLGYAYEKLCAYPQAVSYLEESVAAFLELCLPDRADQAQRALDRCRTSSRRHAR
jgi:DNA-binding SARP family transcriptional activator/DNA polymerase III delta prime subunit